MAAPISYYGADYTKDLSSSSNMNQYGFTMRNAYYSENPSPTFINTLDFAYSKYDADFYPEHHYNGHYNLNILSPFMQHSVSINWNYDKFKIDNNTEFFAVSTFNLFSGKYNTINTGIFYTNKFHFLTGKKLYFPLPYFEYKLTSDILIINAGIPFYIVLFPENDFTLTISLSPEYSTNASIKITFSDYLAFSINYKYYSNPFYSSNLESDDIKTHFIKYQEAGCSIIFNTKDFSMLSIYSGYRYDSSAYYSDKIYKISNESNFKEDFIINADFKFYFQ